MRFLQLFFFSSAVLFILISCTATGTSILPGTLEINIPDTPVSLKDTISITAVGDIMIGSAYPTKANLPRHDGLRSFKYVDTFLKGDIVFGNLEGCFLNTGRSTKCKD